MNFIFDPFGAAINPNCIKKIFSRFESFSDYQGIPETVFVQVEYMDGHREIWAEFLGSKKDDLARKYIRDLVDKINGKEETK